MSNLKEIFRDFTLFIDGQLFSGDVEEIELPKLKWKVEEYRGGGMDLPVDVTLGHEKLTMSFTLTCHSPYVLSRYGLAPNEKKIFKVFGHLVNYDGSEKGMQLETHGIICEFDPGTIKPGSKNTVKGMLSLNYLKHVIGNQTILEIDALNKKFIVNGVDKDTAARRFLGLN
jgi:P2 family phage contractile tail tube protein